MTEAIKRMWPRQEKIRKNRKDAGNLTRATSAAMIGTMSDHLE